MNTHDDPFLAAIRAAPADRTARLVYADWLQERGDPRGELVRVCEAMRDEPVWADRYWQLKAQRNELWEHVPIEWLEATGYDGSYYDPIFRSGVPDGVRERWRLIREFTERWHGIDVPDVGGRREEVQEAERRLGLRLPPSVQEFVAYAHDLGNYGTSTYNPPCPDLFHCAHYQLERLSVHSAVSLIHYTLSDALLGVADEDLDISDPPTHCFRERWSDVDFDNDEQPTLIPETPEFCESSLSQSIFWGLFIELPTAGGMETTWADRNEFQTRLAANFPIHARLDDAVVYEADEMLVFVSAVRNRRGPPPGRFVTALVRRPIPVHSIPSYLFGTDSGGTSSSGLLGPEWFRRQQEEESRRSGYRPPPRWMSSLRRRAGEQDPPPGTEQLPHYDGGDDIPF